MHDAPPPPLDRQGIGRFWCRHRHAMPTCCSTRPSAGGYVAICRISRPRTRMNDRAVRPIRLPSGMAQREREGFQVDLYEYQGRELFARHGLPVLDGGVAETPDEARAIAERLGGRVVVKAQVKVGGRGKAGGVKLANGVDEAEGRARDILGMDIKSHTVHKGKVTTIAVKVWQTFVDEDATLIEVNPLAKVKDGRVLLLDAKVTFDDNATFRHTDHEAWADRSAVDPLEQRAKERDLNYVKLDGEVGIIGNGAGLVMSTLDVVAYAGEEFGGVRPANFLDIGGGASAEVMANGLEIVLSDPSVKSVFVNVFGGITSCDAVANGILQAFALLGERGEAVDKPLVVRLDGNNADEGRQILDGANNPLVERVDTMDGAARRAAELARA